MLFAGGCAISPRPTASVTQTDTGNAWRVVLPAGTVIIPPNEDTQTQLRAVAVNEVSERGTGDRALTLIAPLQLVSAAYMAERNDTEKRYALRIAELETQLKSATTK